VPKRLEEEAKGILAAGESTEGGEVGGES